MSAITRVRRGGTAACGGMIDSRAGTPHGPLRCWFAWRLWPWPSVARQAPNLGPTAGRPRPTDPAAVEFFEKNVRPILAARCQGCHGPAKQKGGLRLDARAALIAGGSTGPAVVPGNPKESLLVDAINYGETYQMPPKSKLPDRGDRHPDRMGQARRPLGRRDARRPGGPRPPRTAAKSDQLSKEEFQERARYWSFQPIRPSRPPP